MCALAKAINESFYMMCASGKVFYVIRACVKVFHLESVGVRTFESILFDVCVCENWLCVSVSESI